MGQLSNNFQLNLPYMPDFESDTGDNWLVLDQWANQYPGIRLWGKTTNTDSTTGLNFPAVGQVLIAGGAVTDITDGSGNMTLFLPTPFPNSLITVVLTNANVAISPIIFAVIAGTASASGIQFTTLNSSTGAPAAGATVTYNWIALGF